MGLLDATTFPFDHPDGKELWATLSAIYFRTEPIIGFMRSVKLKPQDAALDRDATSLWEQALDQAARSGKLRALLDAVAADAESVGVRPLIERLRAQARSAVAAAFDAYSLAMLPATRSFIDRKELRNHLKEFEKNDGARVLVLRGATGLVGRTHSWYLINTVGRRIGSYDSYRFDLTDWSGPPQGPQDVMLEICDQLGWRMPPVEPNTQPTTVVRRLVASFKNLGRTLPRRTCLVFDGYTADTADDWARALVVGIAAAANNGEAGDVCVALLEVDAKLTSDLARDAMPEDLRAARLQDLKDFFTAAAAAAGESVDNDGMTLLLKKVLGTSPYPDEIALRTVGPKAAKVAAAVFGGER